MGHPFLFTGQMQDHPGLTIKMQKASSGKRRFALFMAWNASLVTITLP